MSAEEPSTGGDKAPAAAPKPAATFSSFINKNTTGKKFAPKAARRRPGAAPAPAPTPAPSAPETPSSTAEAHPLQAEPESSNAPTAEPSITAQLPTPAATQEPVAESAPEPVSSTVEPAPAPTSTSTPVVASAPPPDPTSSEPLPTPAQTQADSAPHTAVQPSSPRGLTTQYLEDDIEAGRSPKRRRIEPPAQPDTATSRINVPSTASPTTSLDETASQQPAVDLAVAVSVPAVTEDGEQPANADTAQHPDDPQALPQPRKRRQLPWTAVNRPTEGGEDAATAAPARKPRQPPKPRANRRSAADADPDHVEEDGQEVAAPPKKARKPRKPKGALSSEVVEGPESEVGRIADEIVAAAVRRKPKPKKRREATPEGDEVDGIDGEDGTRKEKKRRGRPPREATPSDAEDQTIDPDVTYMDSLAARTVRWGKLSAREKEMRTIDWDAVKQRRREEDSKTIVSKAQQEAADRALAEAGAELAAQTERRPQLRVNADGVMEVVPESGFIDREGDAERELEAMVVTEDQDITARLTTRSFMKNNKRFPNEFLLPGQGRRWTAELTELFYQGLKSFGTDFQMISQMFPGFTRRSIKTKFTREERENPEGIREALQSRSELNAGGWGVFLEKSNKTEESFADADEIKRQMAEKEAEFKERIAAAKAETLERKRQRELAGIDEDGNPLGDGAANKDKGKKKRGKNKQVTFQEEQGVEIVGEVGDDDTWGQE